MFRGIDRWLAPVLTRAARRQLQGHRPGAITDIFIAVCDHFEPLHDTDHQGALQMLDRWIADFPALTSKYQDSDQHPPKQTFFYPIEQYHPEILDRLAILCTQTGSEVEIHLHHADDTSENLHATLEQGKRDFAKHGLLTVDSTGATRYAFIHGNWALANSHPKRSKCGVDDELQILAQTGCYADFTLPSAPDPTQSPVVNGIYYPASSTTACGHFSGTPVRAGRLPDPSQCSPVFPIIQGPLNLNWRRRKMGLFPRIENADLTGANPPTPDRLKLWMETGVHVQGLPEWVFIKLHTHGGIDRNASMLLGAPMHTFHQHLKHSMTKANIRYHYVTAREMANIVLAAESGKKEWTPALRNHEYT